MLRYYQDEEYSKWKIVEDTPDLLTRLFNLGAVRYSILAINREIREEDTAEDSDTLEYKGPFYVDIDDKDVGVSISSAKELVFKLRELGVPDLAIEIYCSGSKGFHIMVHPSVFRENQSRGVRKLPYIYREVAKTLYVVGMDFQVYSGGKGRMWRPDGAQRPDGRYRNRISIEELMVMTPDLYQQWTAHPFPRAWHLYQGGPVEAMRLRYESAVKAIKRKEEAQTNTLEAEHLAPYKETPLPCISAAMEGKVKRTANFNSLAVQVGVYLARAGCERAFSHTVMDTIASKNESNSYPTVGKRQEHLRMQEAYMRSRKKYKFSCKALRALVGGEPCQGCSLQKISGVNGVEPDFVMDSQIHVTPTGYQLLDEEGLPSKTLCNFILDPIEAFYEEDEERSGSFRASTRMRLAINGEPHGVIDMRESAFRSRAEIIKAMEGQGNATFLGNDLDVQRLKFHVFSNSEELEETMSVHTVGITVNTIKRKHKLLTYVEPGYSVNQFGVKGTHRVNIDLSNTGYPQLQYVDDLKAEDKDQLVKVIGSLLEMNSPDVMAHLIAWHSAAHLKAHIYTEFKEFPLLNVWGAAGSGKTATSLLMCCLNGIEYGGDNPDPKVVTTSTRFPLITAATSSTTIPRIFEEFNPSKFSTSGMREFVVELMKSGWNGMAVPRGTIGSGKSKGPINATESGLKVVAPLIMLSEQYTDVPALQERTISVGLRAADKEGRREHHFIVRDNTLTLLKLAKFMTMRALLKIKPGQLKEWVTHYRNHIPASMPDRPRFAFACLYVGLDFFRWCVVNELGLEELAPKIDSLRQLLSQYVEINTHDISKAKRRTEADNFMGYLAEMAAVGLSDESQRDVLQKGVHYIVLDNHLHVDLVMCLTLYKRWLKSINERPVYLKVTQIQADLRNEPYFVSVRGEHPTGNSRRQAMVLDLAKMEEKGIDTGLFMG